ncbi:exopolysaccharide biosynthesis polyprenyl glycosylphosphotransferase [Streptomyces cylindrosporus]|uniref:Exopolysaccharide biosynthesis polyprenyl glycosylphosphotransferase n=1 Tax=Streptomyces cylindrosporus TaxID=2927583 RepID=A0ABS9Y0E1_9ACTN|nr:exopolysaccharide biosynthesis polyprenyl glycosylphosphotransferase [Streptomyces cylindrosporus]MCI3270494.1 exopolysaccharide biosynthesis polyprenyl glycosylphosphotransferase [Streptomyces cylindrosporus]
MATLSTTREDTPRAQRGLDGTPRRSSGCHVPVVPFLAMDALAALTASLAVLVLFDRWPVPAVLPAAWLLSLATQRAYEQHCLRAGTDEFHRVLSAAGLVAVAASVAWWFSPGAELLHDTLFALPIAVTVALVLRGLRQSRIRAGWRRGLRLERALVVGPDGAVAVFTALLRDGGTCELEAVGACGAEDTLEAVRRTGCDAVVVLPGPWLDADLLRRLSWELQGEGVELLLAPVLADVAAARLAVTPVAGLPLMALHGPTLSRLPRIPKELTDRLLAAVGLLLLSPLLLLIALVVRLDSPGPALFRHSRVGLHGREFTLLKFRTMCRDAEQRKAGLAGLNQYGDGAFFKITDDPRITRVGAFLRHWSLDELPQLLNVVAGRMSLVGPRPLPPDEVVGLPEEFRRHRMLVKPGLSGLWQVSGRSDLPPDERMRLDTSYVENWSTALDLRILARTPGAVVRGTGAY